MIEGVDIGSTVGYFEGDGLIIIVDFHPALKFYLHLHLVDAQVIDVQSLALSASSISSHPINYKFEL